MTQTACYVTLPGSGEPNPLALTKSLGLTFVSLAKFNHQTSVAELLDSPRTPRLDLTSTPTTRLRNASGFQVSGDVRWDAIGNRARSR